MRFAGSFLPLAVTLALGAGCATSFDVRTMTAPKVALTEFRTFHLLPTPRRQRADLAGGAYDPMVSNSITNRALRASVQSAFENRGYVDVELMPDFVVAVYASARTKLDLTQWQFTYSWQPGWSLGVPPYASEYQEGSVIVDVINPQTLDLLWRGSATATLGDNPEENTKLLQKAAVAIVEKFPRASARNVVAQR
jgi:uncharacterized protein DUF4136